MRRLRRALLAAVLAGALAPVAAAAPTPIPYRANDPGDSWEVVPPGIDGSVNAGELAAFVGNGTRPPHSIDQARLYDSLIGASPGLSRDRIGDFFVDSSFGVRPDDVASVHSPRPDVTIVRDRSHGIPHVYGETRIGAIFGAGYASAEDRLFTMDVIRHAGRAELASFAGGSPGNRKTDEDQWRVAPYTEAELQQGVDQLDDLYGQNGAIVQRDVQAFVDGVNAFIAETRLDPALLPGEYAAIGRPEGPDPWRTSDVVAIASLIGGVLGKGGGNELRDAQLLQGFRARFGRRTGDRLFRDLQAVNDPEAPVTANRRAFPYTPVPARRRGLALPDPGSVELHALVRDRTGAAATEAAASRAPLLDGLPFPRTASNALAVSARESESGHPAVAWGSQAAYYSPALFHQVEMHAPASAAGPAIEARGASFAGTSVFVELGRGRDYMWSATSAGQDVIDTFATELCEPDGSAPTMQSMHYRFRGGCLPIEQRRKESSWQPHAADMTPAGSLAYVAELTQLGLVEARATIRGRPMIYTKLRSTYLHELDSAVGFMLLNDPGAITGPREFQRAAAMIGYTFNWFYADSEHLAYQNGGANPVRARGVDSHLPVLARPDTEWRGWNPATNLSRQTPQSAHPNWIDEPYLADWNNKQARGYGSPDFGTRTSLFRSRMISDRLRRGTAGRRKMSLVEVIDASQDIATTDFRGTHVLPWALKVIGRPNDPALASAVNTLRAWSLTGAHRIDRDGDRKYEDADAIRIMDAWWPLMLEAQFKPVLGDDLFEHVVRIRPFDDTHRKHHQGSAFAEGWYGFAHKDLRAVLGRRVKGRYGRVFCGRGNLRRCRAALLGSLRRALAVPDDEIYADPACARLGRPNDQWCADAIFFTSTGGLSHPPLAWQNRPTHQQVGEMLGRMPR